jgi:hypothetical protein
MTPSLGIIKKAHPIDLFGPLLLERGGTGIQGSAGGDDVIKKKYFPGRLLGTADSAPEVGYPIFPVKSLLCFGGKPFKATVHRQIPRTGVRFPALFFQQPCQVFNLIPAVSPQLSRPGGNGDPTGIFHPVQGKSGKAIRELFREKIPQASEFTEFIGPKHLLVLSRIGENRKDPIKMAFLPLPAGKAPILFGYQGASAKGTTCFIPPEKGGLTIPAQSVPGFPGIQEEFTANRTFGGENPFPNKRKKISTIHIPYMLRTYRAL